MQDFDMDIADGMGEYYDGGMDADMLSFDLDINAHAQSMSGANHFNNNQVQARHGTLSQQQSIQDSVEPETNGLDEQQRSGRTVVGAGPLPHSYGVQLGSGTGSTVTEFTKRRNWSQRVIEELRDFLYILSPDGRLLYASPSVKVLTGYDPQDIVGKLISDYIHPDDQNVFVREFNESIASGNPLRFFYRFRKEDGSWTIFESHGHPHLASEAVQLGQNSGTSFCRGFFMMARPYPTKNAALLDSFLEHKIENERLRKRIADLKREEREDAETQQQLWVNKQIGSSQSPYPHLQRGDTNNSATPDYNGMPPPAKPGIANTQLTQQNLTEANASLRPDSINDKMARYEGNTHLETIEMLTGLNYREGERSKGISTGAASPTLIRGDAGIEILIDKDGRPTQGTKSFSGSPFGDGLDKKKKLKVADEYVCTDCGTLDSPEWRKGPSGPKTLCNACGLRWAKKEKKRTGQVTEKRSNGNLQGNGDDMSRPQPVTNDSGSTKSIGGQSPTLGSAVPSQQLPASMPMDTSMTSMASMNSQDQQFAFQPGAPT